MGLQGTSCVYMLWRLFATDPVFCARGLHSPPAPPATPAALFATTYTSDHRLEARPVVPYYPTDNVAEEDNDDADDALNPRDKQ